LAVSLVLVTGVMSLDMHPTAASRAPDPVHFVLEPSWLPRDYSTTGGGWVSPAGGLHVYPRTGAAASVVTVGSGKSHQTPVLFTLDYYGFHNPESKSIRLIAVKEYSPQASYGSVRLDGRLVTLTAHTEGMFHNNVTTASWDEHGDAVTVTTEGLTTGEASRFIKGLVERTPPT
jgi:hypothetical protein